MSKKTREQVSTVVRYTVLILVGFVMFYPMLWMVGASFKASNNEIYSTISFLPKSPSFQAYIDGWTATGNPYSLYLINTFKIVIPKVVGAVAMCIRDRDKTSRRELSLVFYSVSRIAFK